MDDSDVDDTVDTGEAPGTALATPFSPPLDVQKRAAEEFALKLGARRRDKGAPVRSIFVTGWDPAQPGPLASLLSGDKGNGGGRGGQLRVKVYLSLLWIAAKEPYDVVRPARAWAALLGLPDFEKKGVRRIQETLRELQDRGFIAVEENPGHPSTVFPRMEWGQNASYMPAPDAHTRAKNAGQSPAELANHRYFRVPSTLWTQGHIARLKGPSLAMLLAILSEQRGSTDGVWFSPSRAVERFGFANSTRVEGLRHLRELGLVRTTVRTVSESGSFIDFARRRNVHEVIGL
jgi:hypothetical protein